MKIDSGPVPFELAQELIEETLPLAAKRAGLDVYGEFAAEREALAGIEIIDIREERLNAHDIHWIERLRILDPVKDVLGHYRKVEDVISRCSIGPPRHGDKEKATLGAQPPATEGGVRPMLIIEVRPQSLLSRDALEELVREPLSTVARAAN